MEDFESVSGNSVPTNFSFIQTSPGTYTNAAGHNGSNGNNGNSGTLLGGGGPYSTPGTYIRNIAPRLGFDLRQDITVNFDAKVLATGNYDSGGFMFGDIADGLTGAPGQLLSTTFNRQNFSNDRPHIRSGDGTVLDSTSIASKFEPGNWYKVEILWDTTPGSLTGTCTTNIRRWSGSSWVAYYSISTDSPFTFDSKTAFFAFGDIDTGNGMSFDNISITGKEITPTGTLITLY